MDYQHHPTFKASQPYITIIATTKQGKIYGETEFLKLFGDERLYTKDLSLNVLNEMNHGTVIFIDIDDYITKLSASSTQKLTHIGSHNTHVDVQKEVNLEHLVFFFKKMGVHYLDVSAGGIVISRMRGLKLLDEMRFTLAGQICGQTDVVESESGYGQQRIMRPLLFPILPLFEPSSNNNLNERKKGDSHVESFNPFNSTIVSFKGIRLLGESLLFFRCTLNYRK